jgi:hypothetical protein
MIPIVEDYLSELVESKLAYLKTNPNHVDRILGTSQARLDRLKTYIQGKPIKVIKGYPRTPAELPCVCILLSGEEETQEGLGDYGSGAVDLEVREWTEEVEVIDAPNSEVNAPYVRLTHSPVMEIVSVVHNGLGSELDPYEYQLIADERGFLAITSGIAEHQDTLTVTYTYKYSAQEQTSVLYESNYRLECWAENGDFVVELYHILKWALLSGRGNLIEGNDLFRQRLSGADFEPAPNFFPSFVYRRALSFWCQFSVSTPDEEVQYISGVETNQTEYSGNFDGGDIDG